MFNKWIIKTLEKRFSKMTVKERQAVRELGEREFSDEPKSVTKQKSKKEPKRRKVKMADEVKAKDEQETPAPAQEEVKTEEKATETETQTEKPAEGAKETTEATETADGQTETTTQEVQETEGVGNGVRVEDLVTKDLLAERLAAFEAKLDAVIKENQDLKDELSKAKSETDGLKAKYEEKDFGGAHKNGTVAKDKDAEETFESYSRQFM